MVRLGSEETALGRRTLALDLQMNGVWRGGQTGLGRPRLTFPAGRCRQERAEGSSSEWAPRGGASPSLYVGP